MNALARNTIAFGLVSLVFAAPTVVRGKEKRQPPSNGTAQIERGKYLVSMGSCNDCHTPWHMTDKGPAPDMTRLLSGHPGSMQLPAPPKVAGPWVWFGTNTNTAFAGPWGLSYAANLTPDEATGTGKWTAKEFVQTIRAGRHRGTGRPLLPPMPWPNLAAGSDADLEAIFAYLQSIPALKNKVPDSIPATAPGNAQ